MDLWINGCCETHKSRNHFEQMRIEDWWIRLGFLTDWSFTDKDTVIETPWTFLVKVTKSKYRKANFPDKLSERSFWNRQPASTAVASCNTIAFESAHLEFWFQGILCLAWNNQKQHFIFSWNGTRSEFRKFVETENESDCNWLHVKNQTQKIKIWTSPQVQLHK